VTRRPTSREERPTGSLPRLAGAPRRNSSCKTSLHEEIRSDTAPPAEGWSTAIVDDPPGPGSGPSSMAIDSPPPSSYNCHSGPSSDGVWRANRMEIHVPPRDDGKPG